MPLPPNRADPGALMAGVRAGVALAAQPEQAPGWQAVGLVLALQGALALALTGYDTADPAAILDRGNGRPEGGPGIGPEIGAGDTPARLAPVSLLLRRAGSEDHLSDPERLALSRSQRKALDRLLDHRNRQLHPLTPGAASDPDDIASALPVAVEVLRHLLFEAPAFDPGRHPLDLVHIRDQLRRLD
ncbi:MAG: hypothetical protein AAF253_07470 [Pseudomonadota bacterium]